MHSNMKPRRKILLGKAYRHRVLPHQHRSLDQCWMFAEQFSRGTAGQFVALRLIELFLSRAAAVYQTLLTH